MAPLFAIAAVPLTIAVGSAVDIGRVMDTRSQLQDIADSAALAGLAAANGTPTTTAQNFITAAVSALPGKPTVTASFPAQASSTAFEVVLKTNVATTFTALVTPSIATTVQSTAVGSLARNVTFTISNFSAQAGDLNQVYFYAIPSSLSGTSLYQWTPWGANAPPPANLLLSNASGFSNVNQTVQVPIGSGVGFALSNTTGGKSAYGANCYGQAQGTTYIYYSHREDSQGSYWDYNVPRFTACTNGSNYWSAALPASGGTVQLAPCNSSDASEISQIGGICSSSVTYPAGNYVYYTDNNPYYQPYDPLYGTPYSRNPLRYGSTNTDCTQGNVIYQWDDNGGTSDDNDYNDAVFTVNCTTTGISKSSIRLQS